MWITMQSVRFVYVFWVWISGGTKKIVNICLLSLQKHKDILPSIPLQFPYSLLFYTVLKHQLQPLPHSITRIKSIPAVLLAASPDRLAGSGGILPFYRRGKQQNNVIAARTGGIAKTTSYLTISKNHIATSPPHPSQNPLPHHTSIRNPPILHTPPLSRQTNHFEKTKKSRQ